MSTFGAGNYAAAPPMPAAALVYGGFWIRFAAYIVDGILLNIVLAICAAALGTSLYSYDATTGQLNAGASGGVFLVSFLIPAAYTVGFWLGRGATPGKMLCGLRVVRAEDGGPLSAGQAIGRFFGYIVSSIVFCLGFIWVGFDARKQGWHDKLASTVVVRNRRSDAVAFQR